MILGHDPLHRHLVLGEGARLVGADDGGAAQGLHGGQFADDGPAVSHAGYPDGQGDGHGGRQSFGYGSDGKRYGCHEHLHGALAPQDADDGGDDGESQDDEQQYLAEMGDLAGERRLEILGLGDEMRDAAYFGRVAGGHHNAGSLASGDERGSVGHVDTVGQWRVSVERRGVFLDRDGLAGERRLVYAKIAAVREAHVGRHFVAGM